MDLLENVQFDKLHLLLTNIKRPSSYLNAKVLGRLTFKGHLTWTPTVFKNYRIGIQHITEVVKLSRQ